MKFPLYLPQIENPANNNLSILAADVGGTKTNIAQFVSQNGKMVLQLEETYTTNHYNSLTEIILDFIKKNNFEKPDRISIGAAGPVVNGTCHTTNIKFKIDVTELSRDLQIDKVYLINDLEATAFGMTEMDDEFMVTMRNGNPSIGGHIAILAPGTGLGEACLFWDGKYLRPMPSEGGHSEFAPRTDVEFELVKFLQKTYGEIIVWERLVSGPAIYKIYEFLRDVKGYEEQAWLTQKLAEAKDKSAVISETAMSGLCTTCVLAMEMLVDFMARRANNMVLNYKATGGLILAGGIPPRIYNFINKDKIEESFLKCDEMEPLLAGIPIYLNLNSKTALYGAAYYGAFFE
ncbi:glucokinase [Cloacibacterium normanense]|uniref:Glucokinase n=1 Tax=Cloacibacterium normanense TaxID=237258 RepID=A0A2S7I535_9FLAO|nr:glucokinase [Cloacibacterium normanense]PPZ91635.1 glucokinase [Cloacibacterium normanense]